MPLAGLDENVVTLPYRPGLVAFHQFTGAFQNVVEVFTVMFMVGGVSSRFQRELFHLDRRGRHDAAL